MVDYKIRQATDDDVELLIKLRLDYLRADKGELSDEEVVLISHQCAEYFAEHVGREFLAFIAYRDMEVLSCAFLLIAEKPANPSFITGKMGTVLNVFTYPAYRKQGVSTRVLSSLIEVAKEKDLSFLELSASESGKRVYEKLGFVVKRTPYTDMRLELTSS